MISDSGYLRLTVDELRGVGLAHLISGLDEDIPEIIPHSAIATSVTGYTEWIGGPDATMTVGWDWQIRAEYSALRLARVGWPSSNVLLQTGGDDSADIAATPRLLALFIDEFDWQSETFRQICLRYACA